MRILALALLILVALGVEVGAAERITDFKSEATVARDASVTVKETIAVVSEGSVIKRGIFRDIPTRYRDRNGFSQNIGLEVLGVRRDGNAEPYALESISNGLRIRIGSADVFIDRGLHTY